MKDKAKLPNPFPGLRSFRSDEDYLFFGREQQTIELVERLQRNRFIAVVGTSGQGKSSLVRCGLLSRLQGGGMTEAGAHWQIAVMHPGGDPFRHLVEALIEAELYDRAADDAVPQLLATLRRSQFGLIEAVRQAALPAGTNFLLVVDQFEEIFRFDEAGSAESEAANDFVAMLREACAQTDVPIYVVATMRSDFIGDCARFEGLAEAVNRGEYLIPRLSRDQFKTAIEGPIRVAGGKIAPRLLQRLLNDLGEEQDQLPCLQHALMRTWRVWQGRAGAEALDLEDYAQVGKMSQALSVHADEVYFGLATDRQRELCAATFKALTVEGSEKRGIRRPRRLQTLCGILGVGKAELLPVIDAFRHPEVSFLMPPASVELRDTTVIDLSHESLMRVWTRLRDWVDEEAKSVGIFRRLSESAVLWCEGKTGLYRDPELSIARAWVDTTRPNASWAQQYEGNYDEAMAFLQASTEAADKETREQEVARQRELTQAKALAEAERTRAEEQTRFAARLKWLVRGVGLVAMVALAAMFFAFAARREAQENAQAAQVAEKKAQAAGAMVDNARGQAEKLVAFLLEDFYEELESTGRLSTVAKLAGQAVAYYDGLPPTVRSMETRRNRAIALFRQGRSIHRTGSFGQGKRLMASAADELEVIYAAGDRSEPTVLTLAQALRERTLWGPSSARSEEDQAAHAAALERAIAMLDALEKAGPTSSAVQIARATAVWQRAIAAYQEAALPDYAEARAILAKAGALDASNLTAASLYAQITGAMGVRLSALRRSAEAERAQQEALQVANAVLAKRPGDLKALHVRAATHHSVALASTTARRLEKAWQNGELALADYELIVKFDPSDHAAWQGISNARQRLASIATQFGRIEEAARHYREGFETAKRQTSNSQNLAAAPDAALNVARVEGYRGNRAAAEVALREARRFRDDVEKERPTYRGIQGGSWSATYYAQLARRIEWALGDYAALCAKSEQSVRELNALLGTPRLTQAQTRSLRGALAEAHWDLARGYVMLGQWAAAEASAQRCIATRVTALTDNDEQLRQWLTIALARQGRFEDARAEVSRFPQTAKQEYLDAGLFTAWTFVRGQYTRSLVLSSQSGSEELRRAKLKEGLAALQSLSAEARDLGESRELTRMINDEVVKLPAKPE